MSQLSRRDSLRECRIRCHLSLAKLAERRGRDDVAEYNIDAAYALIRERERATVRPLQQAKPAT